jgi:hypothetical protein
VFAAGVFISNLIFGGAAALVYPTLKALYKM